MSDCCTPRSDDAYDLAVIGAGSAGFSAAITAAEQGADVALIDRVTIGRSSASAARHLRALSCAGLLHRADRLRRLAPATALDEIMIVEPGTATPTMISRPNLIRKRHT